MKISVRDQILTYAPMLWVAVNTEQEMVKKPKPISGSVFWDDTFSAHRIIFVFKILASDIYMCCKLLRENK